MLKPLHDYVLLEKEKVEKTTSSGIILTSGKEKSKLAVVKAIGTGVEKPEYKVGDRVLYREGSVFSGSGHNGYGRRGKRQRRYAFRTGLHASSGV